LGKREQSAVGFDPENKRWLEAHTATTGESMADFINKRIKEWREANPDLQRNSEGQIVVFDSASAKQKKEADEHSIRLFLRENDHILYNGKVQRKTGKNDVLKIKDEIFFSKYKVDTTVETIRPIFRDEIERFDTLAYEKKKGIKRVIK
jgi:hypothetical protein